MGGWENGFLKRGMPGMTFPRPNSRNNSILGGAFLFWTNPTKRDVDLPYAVSKFVNTTTVIIVHASEA